ncbi:unnamed protein product [Merluccius merluccius]
MQELAATSPYVKPNGGSEPVGWDVPLQPSLPYRPESPGSGPCSSFITPPPRPNPPPITLHTNVVTLYRCEDCSALVFHPTSQPVEKGRGGRTGQAGGPASSSELFLGTGRGLPSTPPPPFVLSAPLLFISASASPQSPSLGPCG